jgi:hypothetical protein
VAHSPTGVKVLAEQQLIRESVKDKSLEEQIKHQPNIIFSSELQDGMADNIKLSRM